MKRTLLDEPRHAPPPALTADGIIEIQKIEIVGINRTSLSYFNRELKDCSVLSREAPVFSSGKNKLLVTSQSHILDEPYAITSLNGDKHRPTLRNIQAGLHNFTVKQLESNLFEFVDTNLDIGNAVDGKFPATLKITLEEKGFAFLQGQSFVKAGAETGSGLEFAGALRNPTGNGEILKISAAGEQGKKEFQVALQVPHIGPSGGPLNVTLKSSEDNLTYSSSFKQQTNSLCVDFVVDPQRKHLLVAEYALRDEIPVLKSDLVTGSDLQSEIKSATSRILSSVGMSSLQRQASDAVLNSAISSVKTSLKYVCTLTDTRNSIGNPTSGEFMQSSVEVALPPGNAQFLKGDFLGQVHRQVGPDYQGQPGFTISFANTLGILYPLSSMFSSMYYNKSSIKSSTSPLTSFLSDRYHLGGPMSLRGFDVAATGPKNQSLASQNHQDSLGGDTKYTFLLLCSVPVPIAQLASASMRAFWFINGGSLGNSNYWKTRITQNTEVIGKSAPLFGYFRASMGSGLSFSMQNLIRIEATYSIPILAAPTDTLKGFQFGVGFSIN